MSRGTGPNKGMPAPISTGTRSFARNWTLDLKERKIRVNAISPGVVPTPGYDLMGLTKEQVQGFVDFQVTTIPLGRVGTTDEIAKVVVFLASALGWLAAGIDLVQPETVVRWQRAGFTLHWTWISRHRIRVGENAVSRELRELIFQMVADNGTWGAPRIHGELQMLGFDLSERTVLRWMRKAPQYPEPAKRWAAFLTNHREAITGMDFFTVPTLTFGVL